MIYKNIIFKKQKSIISILLNDMQSINMQKALEFREYFFNNPEIWFNPQKKYDTDIKVKFGELLNDSVIEELIQFEHFSNKINIAIILVFDQLPYYVYRNNMKIVRIYQEYIQDFANYLINNELTVYTPEEQCFIMMSIRHFNKNNPEVLSILLNKIIELRKTADCSIYKRFYKATLIELATINNSLIQLANTDIKHIYYNDYFTDILDSRCTFTTINELVPVIQFDSKSLITKTRNYLRDFYKSRNITKVCVSFSGGVDSIVLLYLLQSIPEFDICAIHINYGNRTTTDDELDLCKLFCQNLNIPFYIRNITEIKRHRDHDREIYEEITRRIRFGCYKHIQDLGYTIALGHNYDDCLENIVSNIAKQQKYENLTGMSPISTELDVFINRPFLKVPKADIYIIAEKCKLPHLYDSTPKWSERGMKRDILFPQLNDFDPRILKGLYALSEQLASALEIVNDDIEWNAEALFNDEDDEQIIGYVIKNVKSEYYLRNTLNIICKDEKMPYFSLKSIRNLWGEIDAGKHINAKKIWLNKNWYYSFINGKHLLLNRS
jgi:tRNA(Ile)-lysidine synthetase-like protein